MEAVCKEPTVPGEIDWTHPDNPEWAFRQPETPVCLRKFDGTEAVMGETEAEAVRVPSGLCRLIDAAVNRAADEVIADMPVPVEDVWHPVQEVIQVPGEDGTIVPVPANPGHSAQIAGVEAQIRERPLDPIQEAVAKVATDAIRTHGLFSCLNVAFEVPSPYQTPSLRWDLMGTNAGTAASTFASGGIAYFEAINSMVSSESVYYQARVRYSTNCIPGGHTTGWIDLCDTNNQPYAYVAGTGVTSMAATTNTAATASGWVVRGATQTMKVLYQWLDGEVREANYGTWQSHAYAYPPKTPAERLKEILESRHAPYVLSPRIPVPVTADIREQRARETLRRVLGEAKFRDFLRKGFVSVRAKSGLIYQIFPGHGITAVFDKAKMVERLCVVLRGDFPPTDSLITRYLLILNNEDQFRGLAIKHTVDHIDQQPLRHYPAYDPFNRNNYRQDRVTTHRLPANPDERSLVEIFKEMKMQETPGNQLDRQVFTPTAGVEAVPA
jgi:hypothetical protein